MIRFRPWMLALALMWPTVARADDPHGDPSAAVLLWCALILMSAKVAGHVARRVGQPAVLGELLVGVVLGNLPLLGFNGFASMAHDPQLDLLARMGVVLLLFEVGLESTVAQMLQVGLSSALVGCVGVAAPMALGWAVAFVLLPEASAYTHAFVGATLTATSVGITARVLKDLQAQNSLEARIILGAAVIDDVLGLIILALVTGIIGAAATGQALGAGDVGLIVLKSAGFLVVSVVLGARITGRVLKLASRLDAEGVLLASGLGLCFSLSAAANAMGLAPIVGAFAAGLILEDVHFTTFNELGKHGLEELIQPISGFLVPIFFVLMGMRTDLRAFVAPGVLTLALALTVVGVVGKIVAGLGARGPGINRLLVGVGMVPRGEVGLIFANIGLGLTLGGKPVVSPELFSALVVVIVLTTTATPPLLTLMLRRTSASAGTP